jgi:hypothetical protein
MLDKIGAYSMKDRLVANPQPRRFGNVGPISKKTDTNLNVIVHGDTFNVAVVMDTSSLDLKENLNGISAQDGAPNKVDSVDIITNIGTTPLELEDYTNEDTRGKAELGTNPLESEDYSHLNINDAKEKKGILDESHRGASPPMFTVSFFVHISLVAHLNH